MNRGKCLTMFERKVILSGKRIRVSLFSRIVGNTSLLIDIILPLKLSLRCNIFPKISIVLIVERLYVRYSRLFVSRIGTKYIYTIK